MIRKSQTQPIRAPGVTRRNFTAGAAAFGVLAAPAIVRAQSGPLKVGVAAAALGRAGRHRPGLPARRRASRRRLFKELGIAGARDHERRHRDQRRGRARARREADQRRRAALVGAFDSGQSTAIAQVAEQKGIPFVINIAAAPPITEQGYKFVFRNFPTAPMILGDAFANQKELFEATGKAPKIGRVHARQRHLRHLDAAGASAASCRSSTCRYKIVETIAYDPTARDLSVEVAKAKATGAEALLDGQPPQRRHPAHARNGQAALVADGGAQHGARAGTRTSILKTLGKLADGPIELRALVRSRTRS